MLPRSLSSSDTAKASSRGSRRHPRNNLRPGVRYSCAQPRRYAAKRGSRGHKPRSFRRRSPTACGAVGSMRASFGAHSYFVARPSGNLLVDSPRHATELVKWFDHAGGIAHILLSHQDDVADARKYANRFGARVWIHHDDRSAAPYATDLLEGEST